MLLFLRKIDHLFAILMLGIRAMPVLVVSAVVIVNGPVL